MLNLLGHILKTFAAFIIGLLVIALIIITSGVAAILTARLFVWPEWGAFVCFGGYILFAMSASIGINDWMLERELRAIRERRY